MKHSPRGLERIMPGFRLHHSFLLGHQMQDYVFSPRMTAHPVFVAETSRRWGTRAGTGHRRVPPGCRTVARRCVPLPVIRARSRSTWFPHRCIELTRSELSARRRNDRALPGFRFRGGAADHSVQTRTPRAEPSTQVLTMEQGGTAPNISIRLDVSTGPADAPRPYAISSPPRGLRELVGRRESRSRGRRTCEYTVEDRPP